MRIWKIVQNLIGKMPRKDPIIFVIGCTGTGKSDLGIEIAKKYRGEVISVDSMQFYKGLDIATNKITENESEGIPHHMMSFLDPSTTSNYNIHLFRREVFDLIQKIRSRENIPILVGGTTYYAESILYENNLISINNESTSTSEEEDDDEEEEEEEEEINNKKLSNEELWEKLNEADPEAAKMIHPNNRYRVLNALRIFKKTGKRKSELIEAQKSTENADIGGKLRFENSLVLYLDASNDVLDKRLDNRVEKMIKLGLKKELIEFYDQHRKFITVSNYGVMQCIGLKEFVPWLELEENEREDEKGQKLFQLGCENVKLHTRQYARRQRKWYNSRLLRRANGDRKMASTKILDTSIKEQILTNGMEIVDLWMSGIDFEEKSKQSTGLTAKEANILKKCEDCNILISGLDGWQKHLNGKKHKYQIKRKKDENVKI